MHSECAAPELPQCPRPSRPGLGGGGARESMCLLTACRAELSRGGLYSGIGGARPGALTVHCLRWESFWGSGAAFGGTRLFWDSFLPANSAVRETHTSHHSSFEAQWTGGAWGRRPMTAARDGGGAQEPASGFTARRVPDFARLHALEEARVARWKRQNTKTVTVPLAFRLAPDPAKPGAAAVGTSGAAPESGRGGGASRGRGFDATRARRTQETRSADPGDAPRTP